VRQEIQVLKYNLRLLQFEKIFLGWFGFLREVVEEAFAEGLSEGPEEASAEGLASEAREEDGDTSIAWSLPKRLLNFLQRQLDGPLQRKAFAWYRSFERYLGHARSELSRDFFLDSANYTLLSPIATYFEHHKALLSSHPFAKRVLDMEIFSRLREEERGEGKLQGALLHSTADGEARRLEADLVGQDHSKDTVPDKPKLAETMIIRKNSNNVHAVPKRPGTSREHFRDSRGVDFQVSHFADGPRIMHEPDNVIWRLNLAHDRIGLPGWVAASPLIELNNLT
ncbi:unnamed protein product, partial [Amoebophrya sp. A25]